MQRKLATSGAKGLGIAVDARVFQSTNGMVDDFELLCVFNIHVKVQFTRGAKSFLLVWARIQLYITRKTFEIGEVICHVMWALVLKLAL